MVGHLLLGMGPPQNVVNIPREIPLENTRFSFVSKCQLKIAFWLGVGVHTHLHLAFLLHMHHNVEKASS